MKTKEIKKLDKLWSKIIKERDRMCQVCGVKKYLNAHHIFSRVNRSTRWDLENGILLCPSCHNFNHNHSAHKAPRAFFHWLEDKKGKEWVDKLEKKSIEVAKYQDYDIIKEYLENYGS